MKVMITPPRLSGKSDREKLSEMGAYLTRLANDLNLVLMNLDIGDGVMQRVNQALAAQGEKTITESNWNTIKSLIIKSADIIEVYQEKIGTELSGNYVAKSEFGTFQEETNAKLEATSQGITQNYDNIQKIEINYEGLSSDVDGLNSNVSGLQVSYEGLSTNVGGLTEKTDGLQSDLDGLSTNVEGLAEKTDNLQNDFANRVGNVENHVTGLAGTVGGLSDDLGRIGDDVTGLQSNVDDLADTLGGISYSLIEVNAHINSGLLYYDDGGVPVYGLEIGQRTQVDGVEIFNKFARFTADKLSFYDQNGMEVAYISDRRLHIAHVEIQSSMQMGGFRDTVQSDGSVVTRWIGV